MGLLELELKVVVGGFLTGADSGFHHLVLGHRRLLVGILYLVLGSLGGLQTAIQDEWKNQEADFQQFGKDVCSRVVSLEDSRKSLVGSLK